jgi:hypothetical protein
MPDGWRERGVVARAGHQDEPLRHRERFEDPAGVLRRRLPIVGTVHDQHGNTNARGNRERARLVHAESTSRFRDLERAADRSAPEKERCSLGRDGSKIREALHRHDGADARLFGGGLECDRSSERCANDNHRTLPRQPRDRRRIVPLVVSVGADGPARFAVAAAVERHHVVAARREALGDANRRLTVVGDPVEVQDGSAERRARREPPASEHQPVAFDRQQLERDRRM